jgi:hypothetical protein
MLRAILEAAVDFSGKGDDPRRAKSRYLQALRYLVSKDIRSFDLEAHHEKHGGGVDAWHRAAPRTAGKQTKAVKAEAAALKIEREPPKCEEEDAYYDEDSETPSGRAKWEVPIKRRQERIDGGEDLTSSGVWENQMIRYCVREMHLRSGEGMLILVAGDDAVPIGGRLIKSDNLGMIISDPKKRADASVKVVRRARRLLGVARTGFDWGTAPMPPLIGQAPAPEAVPGD